MKKLLYLPIFLALAGTSCSNDSDDNALNPNSSLELSDIKVSFPASGGQHTIVVNAGNQNWETETPPSWITLREVDADSFRIEVGPATEARTVSAFVYVRAGQLKDSVYVKQAGIVPDAVENLSEAGTANCYIARPGGRYRFDATVKGNGSDRDGTSKYIENYGIEISGAASAELLWESTPDGDLTRSRNIIDYPELSDGYVYFNTLDYPGNAVVAVKNASGDILWSWHIWVIEDEITTKATTMAWSDTEYYSVWMDRNLGALNNTPEDVGNRGLLYQGGRKDPFLPSPLSVKASKPDIYNTTTGKGSGRWNYSAIIPDIQTAPGNIPAAVEDPMGFLSHNPDLYLYADWYIPYQNNTEQSDARLWGDYRNSDPVLKTIFDPCPVGYTVPPTESFTGGKGTPLTSMWRYEADENGDFYGWYWEDGTGDYFPFTGKLGYYVGGGYIDETVNYAAYWTRTSANANATGTDAIMMWKYTVGLSTPVVGYTGNARTYGFPIRCVQEP